MRAYYSYDQLLHKRDLPLWQKQKGPSLEEYSTPAKAMIFLSTNVKPNEQQEAIINETIQRPPSVRVSLSINAHYYVETAMGGKEEELRCELGSQVFQLGKVFKPGEKPCVTCTCSTPPDLTCVQRRCPDQPRGCRREAIRGSCCHDIICPTDQTHNSLCKECGNEEYCRITEKTGVECVKCPQLNCPIACTLAKDSNGCSICQCDG
ncbi:unnamed protein product [Darwinula stevensoni]|uniref:VWFC domain-containing protein n=1 Tax=Darwinula stevensoni TaxID=69355 RepID=A0A7R8X7W4_9CRUS|nr:unnamed protein product [Darwinula stevensoni]CAG0880946.1 unnamed protein product [Darwinula stevensoni]